MSATTTAAAASSPTIVCQTTSATTDTKDPVSLTDHKQTTESRVVPPALDHKHAADDTTPPGLSTLGEHIFRAIHCFQCFIPLTMPVEPTDIPVLQQHGAIFVNNQWTVRGKSVMRKCMQWMTPEQQSIYVSLEHQWTPQQIAQRKKEEEKQKKQKKKDKPDQAQMSLGDFY